jgi:hypothetical protein
MFANAAAKASSGWKAGQIHLLRRIHSMAKKQKAAPLAFPRNDNGFGAVPAFAEFAIPSEGFAPDAVVDGAEVAIVELFGDLSAKEIAADYLSGAAGVSDWIPVAPEGEGWALSGIFSADEGPFALFTKPAPNDNTLAGRDYAQEYLLGSIIKAATKHIKTLSKTWGEMKEGEQRRVMADVQKDCYEATRDAIDIIASNARLTFPAAVDQVVFKDGVKCVLTLSKSPEAHSLADAEGSYVTIVIESRSKLLDEGDSTETDPDQRSLLGEDADEVAA